MNIAVPNRDSRWLIYGLPVLIVAFASSLALTKYPAEYPELAAGITFDLVLSAPLVYLFLIRKRNIPKVSALLFLTGGVILASFLLPKNQQTYLDPIKFWVLPVVEVVAFGLIGFSVWGAIRRYRNSKKTEPDVLKTLREICLEKLKFPLAAKAIAFELAVLYFAFIRWKKAAEGENQFTQYKKNGIIALFSAIIFLLTVETIVLHILLALWSNVVAWLVTASSLYLSLQIFAHLKALYLRPTEISDDRLLIRYGLFGDAAIRLADIAEIKLTSAPSEITKDVRQLALLKGFEQFNTRLELKREVIFTGFYGLESKAKTLLLYVDENEKLKQMIEKEIKI